MATFNKLELVFKTTFFVENVKSSSDKACMSFEDAVIINELF